MGRARQRGSVLVIVLVTLVFATFALTAFMHRASGDLIVATRDADARNLRKDAYSALETTLAVLSSYIQANGGVMRSPEEGWKDPLGFASYEPPEGETVEVTFEDESGKMSLPNIDANTLLALFKNWGLLDNDAQELTDSLMTWMKPNYTAASVLTPNYDQAPIPYAAPTRSLRSFDELAAIDKVRDAFYGPDARLTDLGKKFVSVFSLYNYQRPNMNAASLDTLMAMGSMDETTAQSIVDARTGTKDKDAVYFTGRAAVAPLAGQSNIANFNYQISALRINVVVRMGRASFRLSTLITPITAGQPAAQTVAAAATNTGAAASGAQTGGRAGQPGQPGQAGQPGQQGQGGRGGQGGAGGGAPVAGGAQGATTTSLNYPFTVLEFHEDTVAPEPPPEKKDE